MKNRDVTNGEVSADDLTWREQDILFLLAERLTNHEIAERLHLAESTVKDYVGNILGKLYVNNRREAVERAKALGLLERDRKTATASPTNLPPERTPFVGRKDELTEIRQQLGKTRLLSLIGPGGIGKSRLALKVAEEVSEDFENGVFFISLAPIRSIKEIAQTIAEGLKFPIATHEDPQLQLLRYLRRRQLLLVIDNFEHLLDGVGIVNEILQAASSVKILTTSRERLSLQSETILHVGGMTFPEQVNSEDALTYDSITLFMQSALKVRSGFDPSPAELIQIAHICQSVQGMPLAIELAAAWLHTLNVDEIGSELEKDIDILTTELRDTPIRHRSIRTVFDHSWSLLDQAEREIFMRISVFRSGFTREAIQQVTGATLRQLAGLINKSFLSHDPDSGRMQVHELLRQYAQEHLEKTPEMSFSAQEAHAAYYSEFMKKRWQYLKSNKQLLALAEIEADIENVREAWRYYLQQKNAPHLWNFIFSMWFVHWLRWWNHPGVEFFAEIVRALKGNKDKESTAVKALAKACQGYFMAFLGNPEQGYELAKEGVEILKELDYPEALALSYDCLGVTTFFFGRFSEQVEVASQMVDVATEMDDVWLKAFSHWALGMATLMTGDYVEAKRLAEASLLLNQEIGDEFGSALPLIILGHVAFSRGEYEKARVFYLQCLKISEKVGFYYEIQTATKYLGKVNLSLGKLKEAENYLVQCLDIAKEVGFVRDVINLLYEFARLRAIRGDKEEAIELLAFAVQHPASRAIRMLEGRTRDSAKSLLAKLEAELSPETYSAVLERGQGLDLDDVVANLVSPKHHK